MLEKEGYKDLENKIVDGLKGVDSHKNYNITDFLITKNCTCDGHKRDVMMLLTIKKNISVEIGNDGILIIGIDWKGHGGIIVQKVNKENVVVKDIVWIENTIVGYVVKKVAVFLDKKVSRGHNGEDEKEGGHILWMAKEERRKLSSVIQIRKGVTVRKNVSVVYTNIQD